jgi:hypothetical protein
MTVVLENGPHFPHGGYLGFLQYYGYLWVIYMQLLEMYTYCIVCCYVTIH